MEIGKRMHLEIEFIEKNFDKFGNYEFCITMGEYDVEVSEQTMQITSGNSHFTQAVEIQKIIGPPLLNICFRHVAVDRDPSIKELLLQKSI